MALWMVAPSGVGPWRSLCVLWEGLGGIDGLPSLVNQPDMRDSHERLGCSSDQTSQSAAKHT